MAWRRSRVQFPSGPPLPDKSAPGRCGSRAGEGWLSVRSGQHGLGSTERYLTPLHVRDRRGISGPTDRRGPAYGAAIRAHLTRSRHSGPSPVFRRGDHSRDNPASWAVPAVHGATTTVRDAASHDHGMLSFARRPSRRTWTARSRCAVQPLGAILATATRVAAFHVGFSAAEGCFTGNGRDVPLPRRPNAWRGCAILAVTSRFVAATEAALRRRGAVHGAVGARELVEVVVPFMDAHLPPSHKRTQYLEWRARLLDHWEHRARGGPCSVTGCGESRAKRPCGPAPTGCAAGSDRAPAERRGRSGSVAPDGPEGVAAVVGRGAALGGGRLPAPGEAEVLGHDRRAGRRRSRASPGSPWSGSSGSRTCTRTRPPGRSDAARRRRTPRPGG